MLSTMFCRVLKIRRSKTDLNVFGLLGLFYQALFYVGYTAFTVSINMQRFLSKFPRSTLRSITTHKTEGIQHTHTQNIYLIE